MSMTEAPASMPADRIEALESKIDQLTGQIAVLTADVEYRRRQREMLDDLTGDLSRVGNDAMVMATRELEALSQTADFADTLRLLRRLLEAAPTLDRALVALTALADLVDDAAPMGGDVMAMITERLAEVEQKGYFTFAAASLGVVDRVVANFDEHDVELLGDNVVAMLEVLREITQPEMLVFARRMLGAVEAEHAAVAVESAEPPSLWSLARQVTDPEVRRGMARALNTLRAVSAETGPNTNPNKGDIT